MNTIANFYAVSVFVRYAFAGMVILFGLWLALRVMEKDHEKLLKEHQENIKMLLLKKKNKKKGLRGPFLSKPVDEIFSGIHLYFQEKAVAIQGRMLQLSYWGRVAVLVVFMALYCFILVHFKIDQSSMNRESKALYGKIKNAARQKWLHKNN